jgi:hypothetical protein
VLRCSRGITSAMLVGQTGFAEGKAQSCTAKCAKGRPLIHPVGVDQTRITAPASLFPQFSQNAILNRRMVPIRHLSMKVIAALTSRRARLCHPAVGSG